jgi:septin family protein
LNSDILAFEKLLSSYENFSVDNRVSELSLLEKNKFKIQSLNPVNFNIVLVGESGVGKTSFVKSFMTKLFQSENSEQTSNNQTIAPIQSESKDFQTYTYNSRFEKENFNLEIIDYKGYRQNLKINFWVKKTLSFFKNRVLIW